MQQCPEADPRFSRFMKSDTAPAAERIRRCFFLFFYLFSDFFIKEKT